MSLCLHLKKEFSLAISQKLGLLEPELKDE